MAERDLQTILRCPECGGYRDVELRRFLDDDGIRKVEVTCTEIVHAEPVVAVYADPDTPDSSIGAGGDSLVHELGLYQKLVDVVYAFDGPVEYGVVEHELAMAHPDVYRDLWERQGHVTTHSSQSYTLSTYLASLLGTLGREGSVTDRDTDGTGWWSTRSSVSAWSHPERVDGPVRSWADHAEANDIDPQGWPATDDMPEVSEA